MQKRWRKQLLILMAISGANTSQAFATEECPTGFSFVNKPESGIEKLMNVGRYELAQSEMESRGDLYADQRTFIMYLTCISILGQNEKVIKACEKWIDANGNSKDPDAHFVYECLGTSANNLRDYRKAVTAFTKSIEIVECRSAIIARSQTYSILIEPVLALDDKYRLRGANALPLSESLKLAPHFKNGAPLVEIEISKFPNREAREVVKRASLLERKGQFKEAADAYNEASKMFESNATCYGALGLCLMTHALTKSEIDKTEINLAKDAFQKALSLDKDEWRVLYNLVLLEYRTDDLDNAETHARSLLENKRLPQVERTAIEKTVRVCGGVKRMKQLLEGSPYDPRFKGVPVVPNPVPKIRSHDFEMREHSDTFNS